MSNALTKSESGPGVSAALVSFADYVRFGEFAAASQFAPNAMRGKPGDCTLAVFLGAEIGLGPMAALQNVAVINGKPSVFGDAMLAVCMASPICDSVIEWVEGEGDNAVAHCKAHRKGYPEPTLRSFSVHDAKKAGLWAKDGPWKTYPTRMLQMRARGFALRDTFPDVLRGLISREEAEDYPQDRVISPAPAKAIQSSTVVNATSVDASPEKKPPAAKKSKPQKAGDSTSTDADVVHVEGTLEKALTAIAFADKADVLAEFQIRADSYLLEKKITKAEHDAITSAVNERADFIRTEKAIGGPVTDGE
jgi:hypothetical protein